MKIGIIGAGNMGSALARRLAPAGHEIRIASRTPSKAEAAVAAAGGKARAVAIERVAEGAELLILTTQFHHAVDALRAVEDIAAKVVIDVTNPLNETMTALTVGHTTSGAEMIQNSVADVRVVKAFNTIFAQVLGGGDTDPGKVQVMYAGDDQPAKGVVRELIASVGFHPIDAGPLWNARYLEPLAMLTIFFGYVGGMGTGVNASWTPVVKSRSAGSDERPLAVDPSPSA